MDNECHRCIIIYFIIINIIHYLYNIDVNKAKRFEDLLYIIADFLFGSL